MTVLSVNLNKIAVLRNSRGGPEPSLRQAAKAAVDGGAGGITVHPRPDQRHIRPSDVFDLKGDLSVELNIEGNPFAGAQSNGYPGFLPLVLAARPAQCTLVPDSDQQITSDHGFNLQADARRLVPVIERLKAEGIRVSLFMDAGSSDLELAADIGADRIEIYTGPYAHAFAHGAYTHALQACADTAMRAQDAGLGVNAGHDLNQANLGAFLSAVPNVLEVSIGHALIGEAIYQGLAHTIQNYRHIIAEAV